MKSLEIRDFFFFAIGLLLGVPMVIFGIGYFADNATLIATISLAVCAIFLIIGFVISIFRKSILNALYQTSKTKIGEMVDPLHEMINHVFDNSYKEAVNEANRFVQIFLARQTWITTRQWILGTSFGLVIAFGSFVQSSLVFRQNGLIEKQTEFAKTQNEISLRQTDLVETQNRYFQEQNKIVQEQNKAIVGQFESAERNRLLNILYEMKEQNWLEKMTGEKPRPSYTSRARAEALISFLKLERGNGRQNIDLSGAQLQNLDIYSVALSLKKGIKSLDSIDLSGVDLSHSNLNHSILNKVNLSSGKLVEADLRNTILTQANLKDAILNGANLNQANLEKVNLEGAILKGANLKDAILYGVDLKTAKISGSDFSGVDLNGRDFQGMDLKGTKFVGSKLNKAEFIGADLSRADFSQAELASAKFINSILSGAKFIGKDTNLFLAKFEGADLLNTDFSYSNLFQASFNKADLSGAKLFGANALQAQFDHSIVSSQWPIKGFEEMIGFDLGIWEVFYDSADSVWKIRMRK